MAVGSVSRLPSRSGRSGPSGKLDIVVSDTQGDQGAARLHSGNGRRRRAGNRRRIDDECRATDFLQDLALIGGLAVDIMMSAELLRELGLVDTPIDRRYLEAHVARILDGEMTKAADTDDRDQIACLGWRVAQRSERGQPRA